MINKLATLLKETFATDQGFYLEQQKDGTYRKKSGTVTVKCLERMLKDESSIAILQKNIDSSVKWICFDFDILKSHLDSEKTEKAKGELKRCTAEFCYGLELKQIPYLLEFSGNRGFHIWVTFKDSIEYRAGFEFQQAILEQLDATYDEQLVALDLFPKTPNPTSGIGNGVKVPLSLHSKSGCYARLLPNVTAITSNELQTRKLEDALINESIEILNNHSSITKAELETLLNVSLNHLDGEETAFQTRVKSIKIESTGFTVEELFEHWKLHPPLQKLANKIEFEKKLTNDERKLLVGMMYNLKCKSADFHFKLLEQIFSKTENYNPEKTQRAINALASFTFPSQEQIENSIGIKFEQALSLDALLVACIPKYLSYEDATFKLCLKDIEITRVAELNYLFINDEVQSRLVINALSNSEAKDLYSDVQKLIERPEGARFYRHTRQEEGKNRILISLGSTERVATSAILKQLLYFLDIQPSNNSYGYRLNRGFQKGYIFQPWLYKWIEFTRNIGTIISDKEYKDHFIVKTDIKSFYDEIPHDNLKRLLLGGENKKIDIKLSQLSEDAKKDYVSNVDVIFAITKNITFEPKGLPQGPAYARFLAEIYLDNLDSTFDARLASGQIQLYQRYVDDIFFVAPNEEAALNLLHETAQALKNIGLSLNKEKTICKQIGSFTPDFNEYRSQSKYAVDSVSKNFNDATDAEKDNAITEFLSLIQSHTCNDDLAFIFSHLAGVDYFDKWKREKVLPILLTGIGRGSLFRHLFNFIFEHPENWIILEQVDGFTPLESEALTSALLDFLIENVNSQREIKSHADLIINKLTMTPLVQEHIIYLILNYGHEVDIKRLPPKTIIECLKQVSETETLNVTHALVEYINTELNNIKSLSEFTAAMYPLCASNTISKTDINNLAQTFFAKIAVDYESGVLNVNDKPELCTQSLSDKFHYLTCLFSVSDRYKSIDWLKAIWKYCINLYNLYGESTSRESSANWLKKIDDIEVDTSKALLIISSIIDGNIIRGLEDKHKIFEKYHSALLVSFTLNYQPANINEMDAAILSLADKSKFYDWLIHRNGVTFFPHSNRQWFEENLIKNDVIILKNGNDILIRRPLEDFDPSSSSDNEHLGYSEVVFTYTPIGSTSLKEWLETRTTKKKLLLLIQLLEKHQKKNCFPNIFTHDRILIGENLEPIHKELNSSRYFIYENPVNQVEAFENNEKNFITCFFGTDPSDSQHASFKRINEKYIKNLEHDIDSSEFLFNIGNFFSQIDGNDDDLFMLDVFAASSLYECQSDSESQIRIAQFVGQYHKFHNDITDRLIYGIDEKTSLLDDNPDSMLRSVEYSLSRVREESLTFLPFYLDKDVEDYRLKIEKIVGTIDSLIDANLADFNRININVSHVNNVVNINGISYNYENVVLLHSHLEQSQEFTIEYTSYIRSAEHIYGLSANGKYYLVPILGAISKIYRSIEERLNKVFKGQPTRSYIAANVLISTQIETLNHFGRAITNIATHRGISYGDAEEKLKRWLVFLPVNYHQCMVTLLAAHVVMKKDEITSFLKTVNSLLSSKDKNPFTIKCIEDMGGTHRLLIQDTTILRNIDSFHPSKITDDSKTATMVVENIISGSQVISAMKYYLGVDDSSDKSKTSHFYRLAEDEKTSLKNKLNNLTTLNICTVLYSDNGLEKIKAELNNVFEKDITINIIHGRCMNGDAIFGTSSQIGEYEKSQIRELLTNTIEMKKFGAYFNRQQSQKVKALKADDINTTNLVARYQSLPKKAFLFLSTGLRADADCHPFVRIPEAYEITSGNSK
ncbi:reverse transcriptase domain-containing protein [Methylomonas sp. MV1]|uniref:reverse transcriptase domain-containing protein n=1 Tax=Methylomonas sp. MV1 TaxID=3073620 RepID=UPI0028A3E45A|nr:reverse transcriptase domain-containing protein [Methylomonas sp. MV1]MDT4328928.1 reverse transcriptase domain-containing protein [Methylomonas sp. MV1]